MRPSAVWPVLVGVAVGALTALAGSAVHLDATLVDGVRIPGGLVLAVAFVLAVDVTVALAFLRPTVLIADALGRAAVLFLGLSPGPGGDVVLVGRADSEIWVLLAVLLPAFGAPVLSTWRTTRSIRRARSAGPGGDLT